jgi:ATP-dependent DNA helicase PIF1
MKIFETKKIELTEEFTNALEVMENTRDHVFVTGKAGTGKSTLLKHFCKNTSKKIAVLAPTGVSAINIKGSTLHSFFLFPFGVVEEKNVDFLRKKIQLFKHLECIVIDEVSMVRADLMNAIDYSLRINTGNRSIPFGGVQVIMFGDLHQLSPVVRGEEADYLRDRYNGSYFFRAPVFEEISLKKILLTKIFRQRNSGFKNLLNNIRHNKMAPADFQQLNSRCCEPKNQNDPAIILATTNYIVNDINERRLNQINLDEYAYEARVKGKFPEKDYPADYFLKLKVGAQIMVLKNDSQKEKRWVNGTLGIVEELGTDHVKVNINGLIYRMEKSEWEIFDYKYDQKNKKIVKTSKGSYTQYPLKLAWAVTIHKSQGKTFDRVIIDLGRGAFSHGQTYVALSRCKEFENIYLKRPVRYNDIILDKEIEEF